MKSACRSCHRLCHVRLGEDKKKVPEATCRYGNSDRVPGRPRKPSRRGHEGVPFASRFSRSFHSLDQFRKEVLDKACRLNLLPSPGIILHWSDPNLGFKCFSDQNTNQRIKPGHVSMLTVGHFALLPFQTIRKQYSCPIRCLFGKART